LTPYNYHWRTSTRPRILERDGHRCRRCGAGGRLDVAHLDQDNCNDTDSNLATLCRLDHRRHDLANVNRKCHETRAARKDRGRPLLELCG